MLLSLFLAFFQIGLFSIGGGYAALPLIQAQAVQAHGWLTMSEFADIVTISQMTPGPIAINAATFVGTRVAGLAGAVVATLGCVFPSFVIVMIFAILYRKYHSMRLVQGVLRSLQPAVVGLIASAGVSIINHALLGVYGRLDYIAVAIIAACLLVLRLLKLNPILVILGAGVMGGAAYTLLGHG
jgi:chromate transporter